MKARVSAISKLVYLALLAVMLASSGISALIDDNRLDVTWRSIVLEGIGVFGCLGAMVYVAVSRRQK